VKLIHERVVKRRAYICIRILESVGHDPNRDKAPLLLLLDFFSSFSFYFLEWHVDITILSSAAKKGVFGKPSVNKAVKYGWRNALHSWDVQAIVKTPTGYVPL
jgi:hypothetical protein